MNRFTTLFAGGLAALITVVALQWPTGAEATPDAEALSIVRAMSRAFSSVSEEVIPSVVTISSKKVIKTAQQTPRGDEFDEFFWRFFGNPDEDGERRQQALGSGVIISSDGYILTNHHVVANADEIAVIFSDGEEKAATIVGTDRNTDVAVIKIEGNGYPAARLGHSENVHIGEWVLAIGSPFSQNLGATVTAGIVSGTGRGLGLTNYEDFIQTDAAINPGNSGGALVNLDGEVIGINTAIATRSGGSQGVGFAIPIDMVNRIKDDLIRDGKVTRGYIGIGIQEVTKDIQEGFKLPTRNGILISRVETDSPAEEAGLKQGDVIRHLNGKEIETMRAFRNEVAAMPPGSSIKLGVYRDGKDKTFSLRLALYPDDNEPLAQRDAPARERLGIAVAQISPELMQKFGLERTSGIVVTDVRPGSVAAENGLRPGDVILELNQTAVAGARDFRESVKALETNDVALLLVEREDATFFAALRVRGE